MYKLGFIGYGSMGSMLVNGFISTGVIAQDEVIVTTRTKSKLDVLKAKWENINIAQDNADVAQNAKYIFLCVKPLEIKGVLEEIKDHITLDTHIISISGCVTLKNIEKLVKGKVTKVIPSLTSEVKEGISLVCHNNRVADEDAVFVEGLLNSISTVKNIMENDFEAASDLTSCAPGFIASIFEEMVNSALRHSGLSREDAEEMVTRTLLGAAKLFCEKNMKFGETITRVATKGGITEEGVKVLRAGLPKVFDEVFIQTLGKHEKIKKTIRDDFNQ